MKMKHSTRGLLGRMDQIMLNDGGDVNYIDFAYKEYLRIIVSQNEGASSIKCMPYSVFVRRLKDTVRAIKSGERCKGYDNKQFFVKGC